MTTLAGLIGGFLVLIVLAFYVASTFFPLWLDDLLEPWDIGDDAAPSCEDLQRLRDRCENLKADDSNWLCGGFVADMPIIRAEAAIDNHIRDCEACRSHLFAPSRAHQERTP